MYIVYIRERYCFSLVCTFEKVVYLFKVKVDAQKGALRFRNFFDNRCISFIHCYYMIIILNDYHVCSC